MHPCYRYINLPKLPDSILEKINYNFDEYQNINNTNPEIYLWSDSFNQEVNQWCQENICNEMYWAFQIIRADLPVHRDIETKTKFCYLLDTGGSNVVTNFYSDDQTTVVESVKLEAYRWHILKVDSYHDVVGVVPGHTRVSITGRIF